MKPQAYLALPLIATLFNLLLALAFLKHSKVKAQEIPAVQESARLVNFCTADDADEGGVCGTPLLKTRDLSSSSATSADLEEEEEDPNLQWMPGVDFKAYVRPDISTFYREEPGSRQEKTPSFNGQGGKFVNMSPKKLALYWDSGVAGDPGRFISYAGPWESTGTSTFPSHRFFFAPAGKPEEPICRFNVVKDTFVYFYDPYSEDQQEPARCVTTERRSLQSLDPSDREMYDALKYNLEFAKKYREFTGNEWMSMYPRSPPNHKIWRTDYLGQEHEVQTRETQFTTMPPPEELPPMRMDSLRRNATDDILLREYRMPQTSMMNFTLKTVSCAPRALEIMNFLSDVEVEHILDLAQKKHLHLSTTGSSGSSKADVDTRTSTNTWVGRYSSPITDAIYRRVADILRLDEALLRHRSADEFPDLGSNQPLSEDMQLVHYNVGEQYTAHHDYGYPDNHTPNSPSRSINVLMYLNDEGLEGGETSFPKARSAETSGPLDVKPVKGKAVIFYMVHPDGNLDETTQHAALPVKKGEKWLSNLWIWDPIKT